MTYLEQLILDYECMLDEKDRLEEQLKQCKQEIESLKEKLAIEMVEHDWPKVKTTKYTYTLKEKNIYYPKAAVELKKNGINLLELLHKHDIHAEKIDSKLLKKELSNLEEIPSDLENALNLFETYEITRRKRRK